ncbi:uncharacterized protein LOC131311362 isoform X5 [Rhododendron vialii]|uniref:uncharacterized protein LOC131311362 isoform X5 n=1 Tax=Rhododendron vialii TaxID=182163 RepID=UPI00265E6CFE|nr:uncharacterized protein LOC131311362 isoform X5 [Rhododendron vialii]
MDFIFQIHLLYKHCVFKDGESTKSLWISYPDHKRLKIERQDFELALNCPGHCLIFDRRVRSYRGQWIADVLTKKLAAEHGATMDYFGALHFQLPLCCIMI